MRCPSCDYPLWNLKAGPCPECGTPFKPSGLRFTPNAVRFCCPHCETAYYGTSRSGHLVPRTFGCVGCGAHLDMDEMLVRPIEGVDDRNAMQAGNPWLAPNLPLRTRWQKTFYRGLGEPALLIEGTPAIGPAGAALRYALLNFAAVFVVGMLLFGGFIALTSPGGGAGPAILASAATVGVLGVLVPAVAMLLWIAGAHGLLSLVTRDNEGIGRTTQAVAFTSGAWLLTLIPCAGYPVAILVWIVCASVAMARAHGGRGGRAALSALAPPLVMIAMLVGGYVLLAVGIMPTPIAPPQPPPMTGPAAWRGTTGIRGETQRVADSLRLAMHLGTTPTHGAELIGWNGVTARDFANADGTSPRVHGSTRIVDLPSSVYAAQHPAIVQATAQWPAGVTAHRIGRLVFTHHGVDPQRHPDLAILMQLPGPGAAEPLVLVWTAGHVQTSGDGRAEIDAENRKRAAAGVPPLPPLEALMAGPGPWTADTAPASDGDDSAPRATGDG
ncbi:MAG: hypothetical protein AAFX79_09310 [Planctomycetota bacterium]